MEKSSRLHVAAYKELEMLPTPSCSFHIERHRGTLRQISRNKAPLRKGYNIQISHNRQHVQGLGRLICTGVWMEGENKRREEEEVAEEERQQEREVWGREGETERERERGRAWKGLQD
ncbi:unnamed protein product [Pleuronectes platessa]|uniref:Uncharacterized protein n=1 Tax=Pleuronectes platessa TaxID=8262 RepID=A0A9N7TRC1_PLEPL|nr:unnamed protein product [Pleuronectes platessa]